MTIQMQNAVKVDENGAAESFNITSHDENSYLNLVTLTTTNQVSYYRPCVVLLLKCSPLSELLGCNL